MSPSKQDIPLRVLLVAKDPARLAWVKGEFDRAGIEVVAQGGSLLAIEAETARVKPDLIVVECESPGHDALELLCALSPACPYPIVLFTDDADGGKLRRAIRAGVSAYVVSGLSASRVRPVLEAALARFESSRALQAQLARTQETLDDKARIERAKRQLIKREGMSEEDAYHAMRKLAMTERVPLGEIAARILRRSP
jgi:response regulator NasT